MTVQSKEVNSTQVQIFITHDISRPRGVRVDVAGTLPFTSQQMNELEEFSRRGGVMGIAGKVWNWTSS